MALSMQIQQNQGSPLQTITAYDDESVIIGKTRFCQSLFILPGSAPVLWPVQDIESLRPEDFSAIISAAPDILLVGTGVRQSFLPFHLLAGFPPGKTAVECMSNPAACRTFNLLLAENRHVALALFMEKPP